MIAMTMPRCQCGTEQRRVWRSDTTGDGGVWVCPRCRPESAKEPDLGPAPWPDGKPEDYWRKLGGWR